MDNEDFDKRFKELDLETQKILVKKTQEESSRILIIEMEGGEWFCCYHCQHFKEIKREKGLEKLKQGIFGKCLKNRKRGYNLPHVIYKKSSDNLFTTLTGVSSSPCYTPKLNQEDIEEKDILDIMRKRENKLTHKGKKRDKKDKDYRKRLLWHKIKEKDEAEESEKKMVGQLMTIIMLSSFNREDLTEKLEITTIESKRQEIKAKIQQNKESYKKLMNFKDILSNILVISKILKDKSLAEDKKEFYYQERDKLRRKLKCEPFYRIIKSLTNQKTQVRFKF